MTAAFGFKRLTLCLPGTTAAAGSPKVAEDPSAAKKSDQAPVVKEHATAGGYVFFGGGRGLYEEAGDIPGGAERPTSWEEYAEEVNDE